MDHVSLTIYKWDNLNNKISIEDMCTSIKMSCSHKNITTEMQFTLAYDYNDYYYFNFELGDEAYLYYDGGIVFAGRITDIDFDLTLNTHTFTCYDLSWWLVKSNVTYNFDNIPVKDAIMQIYGDLDIIAFDLPEDELGEDAKILIGSHLIKNKPASTVLKAIMTTVSRQTGRYYYIHMNPTGRLAITECDKYYSGLTIQSSSQNVVDGNLLNYELSKSMQNMVNQIVVYDSMYQEKARYNSKSFNRLRYGVIQDTIMLDEDEDFDAYSSTALKIQNELEEIGNPTEDILVKCIGDINYKVGYGVMVKLPDTAYTDIFMYIIGSEWEWTKDGNFTSTLQLSVSKHKDLVDWEDIEEEIEADEEVNEETSNDIISMAIKWATDIAMDDSHGYSQKNRWGSDYDCSSFVISAYQYAGLDVRGSGANSTHDMIRGFTACGFEKITDFDRTSGSDLLAGDILLNVQHHTCLYIGNGKVANASRDYDGKSGDSTGKEIKIQDYYEYNYGWDCILRLKVTESTSNLNDTSSQSNGAVSSQYIELLKDLEGFSATWDNSSKYGAIGYGTDASSDIGKRLKAQGVTSCTEKEAEEWLREGVDYWAKIVTDKCANKGISLNQYYFDCMVDIAYQWGNQQWGILDLMATGDISSVKTRIMNLGYPRRDKARCNILNGAYKIDE